MEIKAKLTEGWHLFPGIDAPIWFDGKKGTLDVPDDLAEEVKRRLGQTDDTPKARPRVTDATDED